MKMAEYIDPIKPIIEEIIGEFRIQEEEHIMRAVADVGITVDKPRLMKALEDAKSFYEEGYRAAMNKADAVRHGEWEIKSEIYQMFDDVDEEIYVECPFCKRTFYVPFEFEDEKILEYARENYPYCHCGAKMDGKGDE